MGTIFRGRSINMILVYNDGRTGGRGRGPSLDNGRKVDNQAARGHERRETADEQQPRFFCFSRQEGGFVSSESYNGQPASTFDSYTALFLGREKKGHVD